VGTEWNGGRYTSEYEAMKKGALWGKVALILGFIISLGSLIPDNPQTPASIIVGSLVAIAGIVQQTLVKLGYIKARREVKKAAFQRPSGEPPRVQT
jgi:hypothetical protein